MNNTITKCEPGTTNVQRQEYIRPHYDVHSTDHDHSVKVYLPGVQKEHTTITLEKNTLIVEARRTNHWSDKGRALHREIPTADYRLRLQLNVRINENGIGANHTDGVLTINLPVADEAKPRTIAIQ